MAKTEWYVIHAYSGHENKVRTNLENRIKSMEMEEKIFEVHIPTEDVIEHKGGKKVTVQRRLYPGYILVKMMMDDQTWSVVRNTPGVTGFAGPGGMKPSPLTNDEVQRILHKIPTERPRPKVEFDIGETVKVVYGPLRDFTGVISDINFDQSKLKVLVSIFGRETPAELAFDQVAKL